MEDVNLANRHKVDMMATPPLKYSSNYLPQQVRKPNCYF
jgi:hypothetical protein